MKQATDIQDDIRREFKKIDDKNERVLSKHQLFQLFRNLGYNSTEKEIEILFNEIDKNKSGTIDIEELMSFLTLNEENSNISNIAQQTIINVHFLTF